MPANMNGSLSTALLTLPLYALRHIPSAGKGVNSCSTAGTSSAAEEAEAEAASEESGGGAAEGGVGVSAGEAGGEGDSING